MSYELESPRHATWLADLVDAKWLVSLPRCAQSSKVVLEKLLEGAADHRLQAQTRILCLQLLDLLPLPPLDLACASCSDLASSKTREARNIMLDC